MHRERYRDCDNTGIIKRAGLDIRLERERDRGRRWREMDGCRETNIMWGRHNDSDTEIMRWGVLEKRWGRGKEGKKTRIPEKQNTVSPLLSSPLFHSQY